MRYWHDWEFIEDGKTILPISVGMVDENDRSLYLINEDYYVDWINGKEHPRDWMIENVLNPIKDDYHRLYHALTPLADFGEIIVDYISNSGRITDRDDVELWGYYGAYDHVALAQRFGPMIDLPQPIPMHSKEIMNLWHPGIEWPEREGTHHVAIDDAKYQKIVHLSWENEQRGKDQQNKS